MAYRFGILEVLIRIVIQLFILICIRGRILIEIGPSWDGKFLYEIHSSRLILTASVVDPDDFWPDPT